MSRTFLRVDPFINKPFIINLIGECIGSISAI